MEDLTSKGQTDMEDRTTGTDGKEQAQSAAGAADKNPIQVAGRVFGALEYLTAAGTAGLMEISTALGLNKSTTRRVLCSLEYMGYVRQNELTGRYEPTFKIVDLAGRVLQKLDIIELVRPYLKELMEQCGETVHLVKMEGADVIYVDKVEAYHYNFRMASRIGSSIPFYRSAVGKALAAHMSREEVRTLWNMCRIERMTPYTITDFGEFMEALEETRRKGYALDNEENETGVRCIAAALDLPGVDGLYAFSISVPIVRMDNDRIRELAGQVLETKAKIDARFRKV